MHSGDLPSQERSMALSDHHIIVIGAGIGGLTAALSLQRHGFKVSVYEQASELREFGAGLMVTPNAMHALEFLGVGKVIAATSNVSNEQLIKHFQSGKIIHRRPAGDYYKSKYGAGHFQVHRADLHNALKAAVLANDPDCVHLAHAFSGLVRLPVWVLCHEYRRSKRRCVTVREMKVGPSGSAIRS